jgi:hypothetical protein
MNIEVRRERHSAAHSTKPPNTAKLRAAALKAVNFI